MVVQVKRMLQILYMSLARCLRQPGESSCGMEAFLVEAGGTVMVPQLVKMGWGWRELDQTLPHPPGEFFPPTVYLTSLTGEE